MVWVTVLMPFSSGCAVSRHPPNTRHQDVCSLCGPQTALWVRQWFSLANLVIQRVFLKAAHFCNLHLLIYWLIYSYTSRLKPFHTLNIQQSSHHCVLFRKHKIFKCGGFLVPHITFCHGQAFKWDRLILETFSLYLVNVNPTLLPCVSVVWIHLVLCTFHSLIISSCFHFAVFVLLLSYCKMKLLGTG